MATMYGEEGASMKPPLLMVEGLTKNYPGVAALKGVQFTLCAGTVHALVGENGAGKSTLIKAIMGIVHPDKGDIWVEGRKVLIKNPQDAFKLGIFSVFQELSLIPDLTVAENIFLENRGNIFFLNRHTLVEDTRRLMDEFHMHSFNPRDIVRNLSSAQKQLAEILKAISGRPKILILDEPTSSLTENETAILFNIIALLKANGVGIIYITHRMNELHLLADEITILRDGLFVDNFEMKGVSLDKIVSLMVGRKLDLHNTRQAVVKKNETILEVKNLRKKNLFNDISFNLYKGEILGVAGLVGSGRSELMFLLFGIDKADGGEIWMDGEKIQIRSVKDAIKHKINLVPESRHLQGLVLSHSVAENLVLPMIKRFQNGLFLEINNMMNFAVSLIKRYDIRTDSAKKIVSELSGGNQQKIVVSKWLATNPRVLIIDEPTAGIDVSSKVEIHRIIRTLTEQGLSVIMISSEMPELLANSDRIMIMDDHAIIGVYEDISQEEIMSKILEHKNQIRIEESHGYEG
jgi:ABC-type sugar transport system ATPase subunit